MQGASQRPAKIFQLIYLFTYLLIYLRLKDMNRCANCLSENVIATAEKDRIFYVCKNCGKKNTEILDSSRPIYVKQKNGMVYHKTVAALVKMNGKYLFLNRRNFPFGYALPTGHVYDNETPEEAMRRELFEETGLNLEGGKLILNESIYDRCKNGGDVHEWFLFEYNCKNRKVVHNEESSQVIAAREDELKKLDIVTSTKYVLSRIGLLENVTPPTKPVKADSFAGRKNNQEKGIIENLPFATILYGTNGKATYSNKAGKEFLHNLKKQDPEKYQKFVSLACHISKKCQKSESYLSSNINLHPETHKETYNVVANPIFEDGKVVGSSLVMKDVSDQARQEAINVLSYQTSLAISSPSSIKQIISTLLKQLFSAIDITGCSLMTLENDRLKISFRYSNTSQTKRKAKSFKVGEGVAGWVALHKMPLAIPDTSNEPMYVGSLNKQEKSLLSVPVISNNITFGVLNLSRKQGEYFSEQEIKIAQIVANRIALAMENDQLIRVVQTEKEQLNNIISNSGEGVAVIDSGNKSLVWNNAIRKITGFETVEEYMNANPDSRERTKSFFNNISKYPQKTIYRKVRIKNPDGQTIWLGATYSAVKAEGGKNNLIVIMVRDISKEQEIESQQKEFIYTATHELRTPITAIKGYLSMILAGDAGPINNAQKVYFDRASHATNKLIFLVEDLLKVARLEENRTVFETKPCSSTKLIQDVCGDFQQKAKSKKITIKCKYKSDVRFVADYEKTRQALANVIDNAIKYTRKGTVTISIKKEEKLACISVSDTGVGIPKKDHQIIFNKFIRIPNPESIKAGGTGLGLFIVKNLIEKQGGSVRLESCLNKGTKISLCLPAVR